MGLVAAIRNQIWIYDRCYLVTDLLLWFQFYCF